MNCTRIRRLILSSDVASVPHEVRAHVASCPGCLRALEQASWTCRLIALKRYEHPSDSAEQVCLETVRRHIRATETSGAYRSGSSLFDGLPAPGLVYATALVGLVVMGVLLAGSTRVPSLSSTLPPDAVRFSEVSQVLSLTNGAEAGSAIPRSEFSDFSQPAPPPIERVPPTLQYVGHPTR